MRIGDKPLSELTDQELEAELLRRRRARAGRGASTHDKTPRLAAAARRAEARQWYANLELAPGATEDEIEAAYERLMARYHPDKHKDDPEKHAAAQKLADGLQEARDGLLAHLAR